MAENTIEIEVELKGQEDTLEGLEEITSSAEGIGETFKGVGDLVGKTNKQLGESFNAVSDAVSQSAEAVTGIKDSFLAVAEGSAGISALFGPIALLTAALGGVYEAYRQVSGAAREAEERQEALAAASSDLTQKLEALAEKGLIPARNALLLYVRANLEAQLKKELLEKKITRATRVLLEEQDAQKQATKAAQAYVKAAEEHGKSSQEAKRALVKLNEETAMFQKAIRQSKTTYSALGQTISSVNTEIAAAESLYKSLEDQTKESLQTKAKEQAVRLAEVKALQAQVQAQTEADKLTRARNAERQKDLTLSIIENLNTKQLTALTKAQKVELESLNEAALKDAKLAQEIAKLNEKKGKSRGKVTKATQSQAAALKALEAEQRRQLLMESQLRQLDIKLAKEGDDERLALARERYETGLQLAKDNVTARAIVQKQYQLETQQIRDQAFQRELANMDKLEKERELRRQKRLEAEKQAMRKQAREQEQMLKMVGDVIDRYGEGLAKAGVNALLFGEGFKKAAGEVLKGLAVESGVRALMETAKAAAALFINPALAASHAKSAGLYVAAAAAARAGAGALGAGGGGGGATASPTGAPQVATAPQRETAETQATTININFGGAVVYDTREAARRAMMNELVRTYNGNPRSVQRFSMR